jgi:mannonate dehydratase
MRVALGQFNELTAEKLTFARQLGVAGVQMNTPLLPGDRRWEYDDLVRLRRRAEEYDLRFEAIENVPISFYDQAMLGLPGRDEQIEHYQATIRNLGRAGIPILGYHFMPNSVWRTSRTTAGRGGAHVTAFDLALVQRTPAGVAQRAFVSNRDKQIDGMFAQAASAEAERVVATDERMWANYEYFMRAVLPVAKEAGVKLALHPDDPPVPMLGGIARLFRDVDGFKRAAAIAEEGGAGEAWGLDLCLGCCSEMPGGAANVAAMIEHFGPRGQILYVHFRDVQGTTPRFQECFIGEGNYDAPRTLLALKRAGFGGFLLDDHVPRLVDDTTWAHRGRAHAIGYLQGALATIEALA